MIQARPSIASSLRRFVTRGREHDTGPKLWNSIWATDSYAHNDERQRRARRRIEILRRRGYHLCDQIPLLDVGCGSGQTLDVLRSCCGRADDSLAGVDFSEAAVASARRLVGPQLAIHIADVCTLPFASSSFAAITAFGVLEHVPDMTKALTEIARILRPAGRLYLTTSNAVSMQNAARLLRFTRRYAYGFQENLFLSDVKARLSPLFDVKDAWTVQGDWDNRTVAIIDRMAVALGLSAVARYIYAVAERRGL